MYSSLYRASKYLLSLIFAEMNKAPDLHTLCGENTREMNNCKTFNVQKRYCVKEPKSTHERAKKACESVVQGVCETERERELEHSDNVFE